MDPCERKPEEQDGVHDDLAGVSENQDGVHEDLVLKTDGREASLDQEPIKRVFASSTCQEDADQGVRYQGDHQERICIKGEASDWQVKRVK